MGSRELKRWLKPVKNLPKNARKPLENPWFILFSQPEALKPSMFRSKRTSTLVGHARCLTSAFGAPSGAVNTLQRRYELVPRKPSEEEKPLKGQAGGPKGYGELVRHAFWS